MKTEFMPYKRKKTGRTNYKKRLKLLISGTPRIVIRKTNKNIVVQIVQYAASGDNVIVTVSSKALKKFGWDHPNGNLPAAYLTGLLAGKLALSKEVTDSIADLGLQIPSAGSRLYAAVKGAKDAGLNVPCSEEVFPPEDRIKGKHIANYSKTKKFKVDASNIDKDFDAVKAKILK